VTLGTCTSYTGGTEITPMNRNSEMANLTELTYVYNTTISGEVMPAYPTVLVGSSSTNQNSGGGGAVGRLPIVLDNDTIYVFRIINESGESIKVYSEIVWFEVEE